MRLPVTLRRSARYLLAMAAMYCMMMLMDEYRRQDEVLRSAASSDRPSAVSSTGPVSWDRKEEQPSITERGEVGKIGTEASYRTEVRGGDKINKPEVSDGGKINTPQTAAYKGGDRIGKEKEQESVKSPQTKQGPTGDDQPLVDIDDDNMKTIVWYDLYNDGHGLRNFANTVNFNACAYKNCKIKWVMADDDLHRKTPLDGDAVLIQSNRMYQLPPPPRRDADQVFVLTERDTVPPLDESMNQTTILSQWPSLINWTMTYRLDSDIPYRYGSIHPRYEETNYYKTYYEQLFREKTRRVLWLVSNCKTKSRRMDYVRELQKFVPVMIIGYCGRQDVCPKQDKKCELTLAHQYKFYLAFEHTFYTDFVTDKLYKWYGRDIVPVVRGGANYTNLVPEGTYINARDFKSPEELGQFLMDLSSDKERYAGYLKRKDEYYVTSRETHTQMTYCSLCEWLNTLDAHRKSYKHIGKWWAKGKYDFEHSDEWKSF